MPKIRRTDLLATLRGAQRSEDLVPDPLKQEFNRVMRERVEFRMGKNGLRQAEIRNDVINELYVAYKRNEPLSAEKLQELIRIANRLGDLADVVEGKRKPSRSIGEELNSLLSDEPGKQLVGALSEDGELRTRQKEFWISDHSLVFEQQESNAYQEYGWNNDFSENRNADRERDSNASKCALPTNGLQDHTELLGKKVLERFPGIKQVHGKAPRRRKSDHPDGFALDFMVDPYSSNGQEIADWLVANADEWGIQYVIWNQRKWNRDYASAGWRQMEDRGSITENHGDHVHVSLRRSSGVEAQVVAQHSRAALIA